MTHSEGAAFGKLLRRWRQRAGLSQAGLAERASLSTAAIAALEQGQRRQPHPHTVRQLAHALELSSADEAELLALIAPGASRSRLPAQSWRGPVSATPLIGREAELRALSDLLLASPPVRLITLTGPGGVGKTRLALGLSIAMQPHFRDGVVVVELNALRDPRLVAPTIANAFGIREVAAQAVPDELFDALRPKHVLLILDNFEHLTGASPLVAALVDACPRMSLLVTSRTALRLRAEQRYPLEPLALPGPKETSVEAIASSPAVSLFIERARATSPGFVLTIDNAIAVAAICQRLDGLPLAIELAAARILELPPRALLARLRRRLAVLTEGSADLPERQQTLRATLDWSYGLLPSAEQAVFRQLAAFAGSWTLQAAEAVCRIEDAPLSAESILQLQASLMDRSLIRRTGHSADEPRFDMLETLHEYAVELLAASGEEEAVRRRVATYYQGLAETAERGLQGAEQAHWLELLASEQDNIRAVLTWAQAVGELEQAVRISSAIWQFWWVRGQLREPRQTLDELLDTPNQSPTSIAIRAKALNAAGSLALGMGDYARARERYEQSVAAATATSDRERLAIALHNLGYLAAEECDAARAVECVQASLTHARTVGDLGLVAVGLCTLGEALRQQGKLERASVLLEQSLGLLRRLGDKLWEVAALRHLAEVARDRRDWRTAESRYKDSLRTSQLVSSGYALGFARSIEGLAELAIERGDAGQAARLLGAAARLREDVGSPATPVARGQVDRVLHAARAQLGTASFHEVFQEGACLEQHDAIELALSTRPFEHELQEPPEASSVERVPSATLAPPPIRSQLISRRRLLDRLDGTLQHGLTLVAAPAGYGKTCLLVDWAAQVGSRARVAWLSLDRADNDPTRFWRHVLAALDAQHAGIAHRTQRALRGGAQRAEVLVDELVADLSELNTDVVLVLDDYHLIESAQIHDGIGALLRRAPPLLHVLLSSRQDPPLALARRRAAAELIELRAADLRFSEVEAAGLLRAVIGQDLGSAQVEAIAARTEGWAAGLQLVALSLRDVATVDAAIRRFSGSDQFVIDYFLEEVLSQLSDETRRFLVGTSVLTRLSPALCDAVLGTSNGAAILDDLERKSMFVAPIDPDHEWFRYHALFAEVLHHVLRREAPETEPDLHLRAINWYVANGFVEDAIEQALAGSNWDRAAELLAGYVPALIQRGEEATVGRLLAALPSDILQRHPVLSPIRAAALMQLGEVAAAVTFMTAAERIFAELQLSSPLGAMLSLHATAAVVSEQGPAMAYAEQAFGLLQPHDPPEYRLLALNAMARAHLQAGAPDSAARVLEQAARLMSEVSAPISSLHMHHHLGHLRLMEGRLRAAGAQFESLLTLAADRPVFARYQALVCLAAVAYERNHLDSAATFLDHAAAARREAGRLAELPFFWLLRARIARARGQLSAAFEALERSEAAAVRFGQVRLQRHARAELTRLALDGHDLETALRWAGELEPSGEDLNEFAREPELLMRARVWLAAGRAGEAVPLLVNALARAEHAGRGASVMASSALLAQALMRLGQEDEARERFEAALVLGEPEGYVRVFVDEGAPLRVLLRSIPKQHALADYAAGLLLALSGARREIPEADDPGPLTKREREVLELLAEGLSNRAMAVQLVASEATIKSHVHHLIAKLGVSTRAQAVVRARQQGLLG